jgi:hypothetical protein
MMGIFLSRSVQTGQMASHIPLRIKRVSIVRRLERFLDNGAIRVRTWYEPLARDILRMASVTGQVHLIMDSTKVSFHHQLLVVSVAYHGRAVLVGWTWVAHSRGHSTQHQQLAVLSYIRGLLPSGVRVSLVGDTEFGHTFILEYLDRWQWDYVLRQSGRELVWTPDAPD